jgi:hypothetical protein
MTPDEALRAVRATCSALPEVEERLSHGARTFFVRGKKSFVMVWPAGHHDDDFPHLWCAAPLGAQEALIGSDSRRFFRPPYVGHRGWVGVRLDRGLTASELAELCVDAYRTVAPATLVRRLDAEGVG